MLLLIIYSRYYLHSMLLFSYSVMSDFLQPHGLQHQASLSSTVSWSLLKFMPIESVMLSNHLIWYFHLKVKVKWLSGVWLCDPMDCRLPCPSIHGIFQARVLEWVAIYPWSPVCILWTSLVVQTVKNLPAMQGTLILLLGEEDPLEKGMAIHSSVLAWKNLMDRGA